MSESFRPILTGKNALVVGIANDQSIAYGCAKMFREAGAELAVTWLNEKARRFVEPLAEELGASITGALDVTVPGQMEAMFEEIGRRWGRLDIALHSIAFAPKQDLQGGLLDCSAEGFSIAMDISCHSFVRMARLAAPLDDGWRHAVRHDLLRRQSRGGELQRDGAGEGSARSRPAAIWRTSLDRAAFVCIPISPGPLRTRASGGIKDFEYLLAEAAQKAPVGELVDIMDVGAVCTYLASPFARRITGATVYVDGGTNIVA